MVVARCAAKRIMFPCQDQSSWKQGDPGAAKASSQQARVPAVILSRRKQIATEYHLLKQACERCISMDRRAQQRHHIDSHLLQDSQILPLDVPFFCFLKVTMADFDSNKTDSCFDLASFWDARLCSGHSNVEFSLPVMSILTASDCADRFQSRR